MSISTTTNRVSYNGDGSTTVFPYNFLILANTDLEVIETVIATGVETVKTLTTHYTVSGVGTGSGNVTAVTAPPSTVRWTIRRVMPRTQLVDYVENDSFPAATHEQALDKLTMIVQELDQTDKRSLRQPQGDVADIDYLPSKVNRASKYLAFDADGDPIASVGTTEANPVSAFMATVLDDANAAAARSTLDVSQAVNSQTAETAPASADLVGMYDVSAAADRKITLDNLLKFLHTSKVAEGRLTLASGVPVARVDQLAKTTLYYSPYMGNKIALYDGTSWMLRTFTELSIAVPASTNTNYDVFIYDNAGTPTLELTAWTNDTTRATAVTYNEGVAVKTGAFTRRYVGTIRTTGVSGQCEDSETKRFVWNYHNRVSRNISRQHNANPTTTSTTFVEMDTNMRVFFVIGSAEDAIDMSFIGGMSSATTDTAQAAVGIDGVAVGMFAYRLQGGNTSTYSYPFSARAIQSVVEGYHYVTGMGTITTGTLTLTLNGVGGLVGSIRG